SGGETSWALDNNSATASARENSDASTARRGPGAGAGRSPAAVAPISRISAQTTSANGLRNPSPRSELAGALALEIAPPLFQTRQYGGIESIQHHIVPGGRKM